MGVTRQGHERLHVLGNGDIGANLWTEESGDIVFYISKIDAWGDNVRLLKIGHVWLSMSPSPLTANTAFRQELDLAKGEAALEFKGNNPTSLRFRIDANHPKVNLSVESENPIDVTVTSEIWRTEPNSLIPQTASPYLNHPGKLQPVAQPDTVLKDFAGGIA